MSRVSKIFAAVLVVSSAIIFSLGIEVFAQNTNSASSTKSSPDKVENLHPRVKLSTSAGEIVVELDPALAPVSVRNFLEYVDSGFYNGTIFHRVIDNFMVQGGGFTSDYQRKSTQAPIRNEANNGLKNEKYTLAMARTNAPHSATAQFFINSVDNDYLDYSEATQRGWGYAVFGRVVAGTDVVDQINQVQTGAGGPFSRDAPVTPIVIESATQVLSTDQLAADTMATPAAKTE